MVFSQTVCLIHFILIYGLEMVFFLHIPPPAKADLVSASRKIPPVALPVRADLLSSETHFAFTLKTARINVLCKA